MQTDYKPGGQRARLQQVDRRLLGPVVQNERSEELASVKPRDLAVDDDVPETRQCGELAEGAELGRPDKDDAAPAQSGDEVGERAVDDRCFPQQAVLVLDGGRNEPADHRLSLRQPLPGRSIETVAVRPCVGTRREAKVTFKARDAPQQGEKLLQKAAFRKEGRTLARPIELRWVGGAPLRRTLHADEALPKAVVQLC